MKNLASLILIGVPLFVYSIFVDGYVLSKLWGWYLVPIFDIKAITIIQGWGICLIFSFLNMKMIDIFPKEKTLFDFEDKKVGEFFLTLLVYPWIVLISGYIVKMMCM